MNKQALVINKEELLKLSHSQLNENTIIFDNTDILNASFTLMSRDLCETDESVVQILPYITLIDGKTSEVFTYRRGTASGEDRLENKLSLGLGGHIEEQPCFMINMSANIDQVAGVLAMNMVRELNEEVGLNITYISLYEIKEDLLSGNFTLFYSEQDQVAKHHLCLHYILYVNKTELTKLEDDCIVDPNWLPFKDIKEETNFEGWSQICTEFIGYELGYGF